MGSRNTWVALFYLATAAILMIVLDKAIGNGLSLSNMPNAQIIGANFTLSTLIGLVVAVGVGAFCWMNSKIRDFCGECVDELRKVSWPDMAETRWNSIVVVIFSFICAGILGVFDGVFSWLTTQLLTLL